MTRLPRHTSKCAPTAGVDHGGCASESRDPDRATFANANTFNTETRARNPVSGYDGGWLHRLVLPFLDKNTTPEQRASIPLIAACWTFLFVACSVGTFLIGRGEDAQNEACEGTSYRDSGECDVRSDTSPVVSYSGILFPERGVFLFFGIPCAPLWFLTILLSHRALQRLADEAFTSSASGLGRSDGPERDGGGSLVESALQEDQRNRRSGRPSIPALRRMEPLAVVATPLLLLVVCVSLGDPQPGPAIHAMAAFFFFLLGVYNVYLTHSAMGRICPPLLGTPSDTRGVGVADAASSLPPDESGFRLSEFFRKARRFKGIVLIVLFSAMVPTTVFWALLAYEWGGEEHMLAPVQYSWILAMTLGNGACVAEVREWELRSPGSSRRDGVTESGARCVESQEPVVETVA